MYTLRNLGFNPDFCISKFYGLVLELVELIVAKGIDVAQPIWL